MIYFYWSYISFRNLCYNYKSWYSYNWLWTPFYLWEHYESAI